MGTHPIFESDFDCLTDDIKMNSKLKRLIWTFLTVTADFAFHDDEDFSVQSDSRYKREASGDYDSSGDGSEDVSYPPEIGETVTRPPKDPKLTEDNPTSFYIMIGAIGAGSLIAVTIFIILCVKMNQKDRGSYATDADGYTKGERA